MATVDNNTFQSSANLSLWFKVYTGEALKLSDVPEIIPLRWVYFRDNWQLLTNKLLGLATKNFDPDYFRFVLDDLTSFIATQRYTSTDVNPFASNDIYYRFFPIFDSIRIDSISLTNEEKTILADKKASVSSYAKPDFLKIKTSIRNYRDHIADLVGLSDPSYNAIYDRGTVTSQVNPSIVDMNTMLILQKELDTVDFILANLFAVDTAIDPFALAKQNANNPAVDIGQYSTGRLVKLNYGEDLPSLANRFFGNPDKWLDIAIANGLKEPYVDEVGQQLFLLANGSGNQINIAETDPSGNPNISKLFINQFVLIQSNVYPYPTQRLITGIKQIPVSGEIVITVDGDPTMGNYLLSDGASIRVFLPNTVNSSQYVLIPLSGVAANPRVEEIPWFLASAAPDEKRMKVDIAVGTDGALLKTSTGDMAMSFGLANALQAINGIIQTEVGSNRRHPKYGLINVIGVPTSSDTDAQNALIKSINAQIQADSRFDRVESLSVLKLTGTATGYAINLVVRLAGGTTLVPITFTVTT